MFKPFDFYHFYPFTSADIFFPKMPHRKSGYKFVLLMENSGKFSNIKYRIEETQSI